MLSRFYGWAVRTGRAVVNPFASVSRLPEREEARLIFCSREERAAVLAACEGEANRAAVWVAFFAGLRLGELARLEWADVGEERLVVRKSKIRRPRVVPMASALWSVLAETRRHGPRVAQWPTEARRWKYQSACVVRQLRERVAGTVPAERVGWLPFRRSFGSLLVQAGESVDTVAAWMGHSPRTCRRHYAEFVPRDARDSRIDALE